MFKKILIPLDGSDLSQRVLGPVRRLLGSEEVGEVTLLRVLDPLEDRDAARAQLDRLEKLLSASGVPARSELREGQDAGAEILELAGSLPADLVAMATHGRTGFTRFVRGSVAERVLRRCAQPLLLCNPTVLHAVDDPRPGFRHILVPLDGSDLSKSVLEGAAALARTYEAELILFMVENFATGGEHTRLRTPADLLAKLEPIKERLLAQGVTQVATKAAIGGEIQEILKAVDACQVDLLAMTTHGRSGASRWWFGSVAEAIVRAAPCPLFIQRVGGPTE